MAKAKVRSIVLRLKCDYCGASENEASILIASPNGMTHICSDCVAICSQMVADEAQDRQQPAVLPSKDSQ